MLSGDAACRYVWANLDIDTIDVGEIRFDLYEEVAKSIRYLKFSIDMESFRYHSRGFRNFVNVKAIWIVPDYGLIHCVGATEKHYWPCGKENVYFVDPRNPERVFRGPDGEKEIYALYGPYGPYGPNAS